MPNSAYLDSCIFIVGIQKLSSDTRLDACLNLMRRAKNGELAIVTSAWTITEVNRLNELEKAASVLREDQSKMILAFFENPYISVRPVDRATAELAHHLTRTHGLTSADAIHVATASLSKVEVLYTYDDPKKKRRGLIRHSLKVCTPPLRIERPPAPTDYPLFTQKEADATAPPDAAEPNGSTRS